MIEALRTIERCPVPKGYPEREEWAPGPWQDEPDLVEWRDATTGYPCLVVRAMHTGALCGYVGLPPGHPLHGKTYNAPECEALEAHGGLTFADACHEGGLICHVPQPGEPDDVWWLGFDCAHAYDLTPAIDAVTKRAQGQSISDTLNAIEPMWMRTTYKPLAFVQAEVTGLAAQLKALE